MKYKKLPEYFKGDSLSDRVAGKISLTKFTSGWQANYQGIAYEPTPESDKYDYDEKEVYLLFDLKHSNSFFQTEEEAKAELLRAINEYASRS